jgi:hypothetical protein
MADKFRYPYPCRTAPTFKTQHEVLEFIDEYKKHGHIKNCAHAVSQAHGGGAYSTHPLQFVPICRMNSFAVTAMPGVRATDYQKDLFHGCPGNCFLYKSAAKAAVEDHLREEQRALWKLLDSLKLLPKSIITIGVILVLLLLAGYTFHDAVERVLRLLTISR